MIVPLLGILALAQVNTPGFARNWWLSDDGTIAVASNGGGISIFKTKPFKHIANYIFIQDLSYDKDGYGRVIKVRMVKEATMTASRWYGEGSFIAAEPNAKDKWAILLRPDSHSTPLALISGCLKPGSSAAIGRGMWIKNVSVPEAGYFAKEGDTIRFTMWSNKNQGKPLIQQMVMICRTGKMTTAWSLRLQLDWEEFWKKREQSPIIAIGRSKVVYMASPDEPQQWMVWSSTGKSFRATGPDTGKTSGGYVTDRLLLVNSNPIGIVHVLDLKTRKWSKWMKQTVVGVSSNGDWALLAGGRPIELSLKRLR